MADAAQRLTENVAGDFYVDASCIDCDACRQIAPATFRDHGDQSSVYRQPESASEIERALKALVACPTSSIGTARGRKYDTRAAAESFPAPVAENVYFCGYTAESSFGAWSYLIVRGADEGGNVLVDSPRYSSRLANNIDALGGVRTMFLTHRDDVADHERYARRFGCKRIMHERDGATRYGFERALEGDEDVRIDEDLVVIPTPGHTRGHAALLYRDQFLFTGDHLAWSPVRETLTAFRTACWHSWPEQIRSMERLLGYSFEWVLPGHGRIHQDTRAVMRAHLERCVEWMKSR